MARARSGPASRSCRGPAAAPCLTSPRSVANFRSCAFCWGLLDLGRSRPAFRLLSRLLQRLFDLRPGP